MAKSSIGLYDACGCTERSGCDEAVSTTFILYFIQQAIF